MTEPSTSAPVAAQPPPNQAEWRQRVRPDDWQNPTPKNRYDLVIIGAGPAGLAAATTARHLGLTVALIERDCFGGNSLNTGSVPSKSLIRTARVLAGIRDADQYGAPTVEVPAADMEVIRTRIHRIRARIAEYHSVARLQSRGVDVYFGAAHFGNRNTVTVVGTVLRFRKALIATGARPQRSQIPGLEEAGYRTAQTIFDMEKLPDRLAVIGGGPLGCELAQAFRRLGSHVTILQSDPQFLPHEERDATELLSMAMAQDGVEIRLNTKALSVRTEKGVKFIAVANNELRFEIPADEIFLGVGTTPNTENLRLEETGVASDPVLGVKVNEYLRTTNRDIYAAGDVCMEVRLTNVADATARLAVRNAFLGTRKRYTDLIIPWCTYCDPEIAHVGLHAWEARMKSISIKSFTVLMQDVDRAITDGQDYGFVKIHVAEGTDTILGATIVAARAGEMINEISVAMSTGIGLRKLARIMHTYPAQSEAIRRAALAYVHGEPLSWWTKMRARLPI